MPQSARIPAATRVQESRVIAASIEKVWATIRPLTFQWLKTVKEATGGKEGDVGSQRRVVYTDGTVQTYKVLAVSDVEYYVTYDVITSEPAVTWSSAIHTIKLHRVTHDNTTFVSWTSDFSNDATQEVISDSKFKKQEAFENLVAHVVSKRPASEELPVSPKKKANK